MKAFILSIFVRNADDGTQILEQILPYFMPDWNTTVNLIPSMKISMDIPTVLTSVDFEDVYEGDYQTRRTIIWNLNGGSSHEIIFNGNLEQYESEVFNIGTLIFSVGVHEINASLTSVNGAPDENISNDNVSESINAVEIDTYDTTQVHLELLTDDYSQETSQEFRSPDGTILYSFGPYEEDIDDNTVFNYSFDVDYDECYYFVYRDIQW